MNSKKDPFLTEGEDWGSSMQATFHNLMRMDIEELISLRRDIDSKISNIASSPQGFIGLDDELKQDRKPVSAYTAYIANAIINMTETGNPKLLEILGKRSAKTDQDSRDITTLITEFSESYKKGEAHE